MVAKNILVSKELRGLWINKLKFCKKTPEEKNIKSISMCIQQHLLCIMLNTLKNYTPDPCWRVCDCQMRTVTMVKPPVCLCLSFPLSLQQFLENRKDLSGSNLYGCPHAKSKFKGLFINSSLVIVLLCLVRSVNRWIWNAVILEMSLKCKIEKVFSLIYYSDTIICMNRISNNRSL